MLKKVLLTLLGLFLVICIAGCGQKSQGEKKSEVIEEPYISGIIRNANERILYFERVTLRGDNIVLDAMKIGKDGRFSIQTKAQAKDLYCIRLGKEQGPASESAEENFIYIVSDSAEKITIDADAADLSRAKITGSAETTLLSSYVAFGRAETDATKTRAWAKKFANDYPQSFVLVLVIEWLDPDVDLELMKTISQSLSARFPNNERVQEVASTVKDAGRLPVGSEAPNFTIKTPDDKDISLHEFRGQYVLVDFWASWCGFCRAENPNVVAAYNKYKDKGFTVFGVSLDNDKAQWEKAIKDDGLVWSHGSDLKGWEAAPAKLYGVKGIPFNVLLDKEGKILAKDLQGEELDKKLAGVLQ